MPDTSKLEKLNRELEKSEKKLRKAINDEKALQHQLKQLTRKERTHRLCTRGGMLESFLQEPERLTDDDVISSFAASLIDLPSVCCNFSEKFIINLLNLRCRIIIPNLCLIHFYKFFVYQFPFALH